MARSATILRVAFLVGAVADALALIPMLFPSVATVLWGIEEQSPGFHFASASAAALMLGWTALLLWAYRRPIERRAVAGLTILVVVGLAIAEIWAVSSSLIPVSRIVPIWALQVLLVALFAAGLVQSRPERPSAA